MRSQSAVGVGSALEILFVLYILLYCIWTEGANSYTLPYCVPARTSV